MLTMAPASRAPQGWEKLYLPLSRRSLIILSAPCGGRLGLPVHSGRRQAQTRRSLVLPRPGTLWCLQDANTDLPESWGQDLLLFAFEQSLEGNKGISRLSPMSVIATANEKIDPESIECCLSSVLGGLEYVE